MRWFEHVKLGIYWRKKCWPWKKTTEEVCGCSEGRHAEPAVGVTEKIARDGRWKRWSLWWPLKGAAERSLLNHHCLFETSSSSWQLTSPVKKKKKFFSPITPLLHCSSGFRDINILKDYITNMKLICMKFKHRWRKQSSVWFWESPTW